MRIVHKGISSCLHVYMSASVNLYLVNNSRMFGVGGRSSVQSISLSFLMLAALSTNDGMMVMVVILAASVVEAAEVVVLVVVAAAVMVAQSTEYRIQRLFIQNVIIVYLQLVLVLVLVLVLMLV